MTDDRERRPRTVERALRQEACFGCCACGNPIFQYHHIIEYRVEPHYRPEDMMVLCPDHHNQATMGVLDETVQRAIKAKPVNCMRELASGQLSVRQRNTHVDLGGHHFMAGAGTLIVVGREALLTTALSQYGTLLLGVRLYGQDGSMLAEIIENEWRSEDPLPWDIKFSYRKLLIQSAPHKISLAVDTNCEPVAIRGSLWSYGRLLTIDDKGLHADEAHLIGSGKIYGGVIELDAGGTGFRLVPQGEATSGQLEPLRRFPEPPRNDRCPCGSGLKYKRCHGLRT